MPIGEGLLGQAKDQVQVEVAQAHGGQIINGLVNLGNTVPSTTQGKQILLKGLYTQADAVNASRAVVCQSRSREGTRIRFGRYLCTRLNAHVVPQGSQNLPHLA